MLKRHVRVNDLLKVEDKSIDFNVTKDETFTDMVSDSILQLDLRKLSVEFLNSIKEEYNYKKKLGKYPFPLQLHICVMPDFLHIQPNNILQQFGYNNGLEIPVLFY